MIRGLRRISSTSNSNSNSKTKIISISNSKTEPKTPASPTALAAVAARAVAFSGLFHRRRAAARAHWSVGQISAVREALEKSDSLQSFNPLVSIKSDSSGSLVSLKSNSIRQRLNSTKNVSHKDNNNVSHKDNDKNDNHDELGDAPHIDIAALRSESPDGLFAAASDAAIAALARRLAAVRAAGHSAFSVAHTLAMLDAAANGASSSSSSDSPLAAVRRFARSLPVSSHKFESHWRLTISPVLAADLAAVTAAAPRAFAPGAAPPAALHDIIRARIAVIQDAINVLEQSPPPKFTGPPIVSSSDLSAVAVAKKFFESQPTSKFIQLKSPASSHSHTPITTKSTATLPFTYNLDDIPQNLRRSFLSITRYTSIITLKRTRVPWSQTEDIQLIRAANAHQHVFRHAVHDLPGRNDDEARKRYFDLMNLMKRSMMINSTVNTDRHNKDSHASSNPVVALPASGQLLPSGSPQDSPSQSSSPTQSTPEAQSPTTSPTTSLPEAHSKSSKPTRKRKPSLQRVDADWTLEEDNKLIEAINTLGSGPVKYDLWSRIQRGWLPHVDAQDIAHRVWVLYLRSINRHDGDQSRLATAASSEESQSDTQASTKSLSTSSTSTANNEKTYPSTIAMWHRFGVKSASELMPMMRGSGSKTTVSSNETAVDTKPAEKKNNPVTKEKRSDGLPEPMQDVDGVMSVETLQKVSRRVAETGREYFASEVMLRDFPQYRPHELLLGWVRCEPSGHPNALWTIDDDVTLTRAMYATFESVVMMFGGPGARELPEEKIQKGSVGSMVSKSTTSSGLSSNVTAIPVCGSTGQNIPPRLIPLATKGGISYVYISRYYFLSQRMPEELRERWRSVVSHRTRFRSDVESAVAEVIAAGRLGIDNQTMRAGGWTDSIDAKLVEAVESVRKPTGFIDWGRVSDIMHGKQPDGCGNAYRQMHSRSGSVRRQRPTDLDCARRWAYLSRKGRSSLK